jgi:hypothetical protein
MTQYQTGKRERGGEGEKAGRPFFCQKFIFVAVVLSKKI